MRRKDREITKMSEIIRIMNEAQVCSLAFFGGEYPYVVPVNFGFDMDEDGLLLYIHGASEGTKIECMKQNKNVGFSIVGTHLLRLKNPACESTMHYESVCGSGSISLVEDEDERKAGLAAIMGHYSDEKSFEFGQNGLKHTTVLKVIVEELHGKTNIK